MGQRILVSCDQCGCKKEMSVGVGLMSNNPDVIASCLDGKEAEEWKRLYSCQKINYFQAEQKVFYCDHCKELSCRLVVDADLKDGSTVTLGNQCGKCGAKLQEVSLEAHHMVCPVCKIGDLSWKQVGLWD